jgi:hypothetical protein
MKKTLLFLLLSIATITAKAQNMSFDETVKYINDKIGPLTITASKDGTIQRIYGEKSNFFDLKEKETTEEGMLKSKWGIYIWYDKYRHEKRYELKLNKGDSSEDIAYLETDVDAIRVFNALVYLRSLCTQVKDPFDK